MEVQVNFENKPLFFRDPEKIVICKDPFHFDSALKELEYLSAAGYWLAGFISYEAGYCLEERLRKSISSDFPLLMFGVYKKPGDSRSILKENRDFSINNLQPNISFEDYSNNIERIKFRQIWKNQGLVKNGRLAWKHQDKSRPDQLSQNRIKPVFSRCEGSALPTELHAQK